MGKNTQYEEFEGVKFKMTPMFEQYMAAKRAHPDAVLFFRMGDFYELFFDDARVAHRELNLTLTARNKGSDGEDDPVPMAGVPVRAMDDYLHTLVENGHRVAICDQLQSPSDASGIVDRGITRVVTPGTLVDERPGEERAVRRLAALAFEVKRGRVSDAIGLAYIDVGTGAFEATEVVGLGGMAAELQRIGVREVLVEAAHAGLVRSVVDRFARRIHVQEVASESFEKRAVLDAVANPRDIGDLADRGFYLDKDRVAEMLGAVESVGFRRDAVVKGAALAVVHYVSTMQRGVGSHVQALEPYRVDAFMLIDEMTHANLEITETMRGGRREGSLVGVLDEAVTSAGSRRLRTWLTYPLLDLDRIQERHTGVGELVSRFDVREQVRELLDGTHDIERLTARLATGRATPRHVVQLRRSLEAIPALRETIASCESPLLERLHEELDPCEDVRAFIATAIVDEPPQALQDGGVIRAGFDREFDEVVELARTGRDWLLRYETELKEETGIGSLKVKFNRNQGYLLEVTRANLHLVPESWRRRQTLKNSERYTTDDLLEYEEKILTADERRERLELELFEQVRTWLAEHLGRLRHTASSMATLDVVATLAAVAHERDYCRPTVDDGDVFEVEAGRHPVVEAFLPDGERFVPNDLALDRERARLQIITGPNMSGKSTVIRQAALIALLAQAGSWVPASRAHIGMVDRIFSRVGASDNLALGQSTFMVEMTETANILAHATSRSLIILDEIGRGTSTYDGLSIAWAVAEYLHTEVEGRVLFATHYHELTELARLLDGVVNYSVAVKEWQGDIIFLRKLVEGAANRSYGIQVARLAGVPDAVIERAEEILHNLEMNSTDETGRPTFAQHIEDGDDAEAEEAGSDVSQFALFGRRAGVLEAARTRPSTPDAADRKTTALMTELGQLSLDTTTPLQALNLLFKWQRVLKNR